VINSQRNRWDIPPRKNGKRSFYIWQINNKKKNSSLLRLMSMCNRGRERTCAHWQFTAERNYGRNSSASFDKPIPSCLKVFRLYYAS